MTNHHLPPQNHSRNSGRYPHSVPDPVEPPLVVRKLREVHDRYKSDKRFRDKVRAGVAAVALFGTIAAGTIAISEHIDKGLADPRTEEYRGAEKNMLAKFFESGKPVLETEYGTVSQVSGEVTITSDTPNNPVHVRSTPNYQTEKIRGVEPWRDNYIRDDNTEALASKVVLKNPVVVVDKDGEKFMGGVLMSNEDGPSIPPLTADELAKRIVWVDMGRLEIKESGADVEIALNSDPVSPPSFDQNGLLDPQSQSTIPTALVTISE